MLKQYRSIVHNWLRKLALDEPSVGETRMDETDCRKSQLKPQRPLRGSNPQSYGHGSRVVYSGIYIDISLPSLIVRSHDSATQRGVLVSSGSVTTKMAGKSSAENAELIIMCRQ